MIGDTAQLAVELKLKDQQFQSSIAKDERSLKSLNATVGRTGGAFAAASKGIGGFQKNVGNAFSNVGRGAGQAVKNVERLAFVAGTIAVGGIVAATKAAINFEDAFSGIRKTVNEADLTKAGLSFEGLSDSIRKMSREMPIAATELAAIGEAAGALGIRAQDIEGFTKVVAELSVTTDLSSEAAATALGQLGTTLHLTGGEFAEFADSLVALGNAGASTESQIVEMASRFAAAGNSAGLTKEEVLALSSAVASMGIDVEAGGTALSQTFNNIATGIGTGSAQAKQFATTLGLSAAQFKEAWRRDALGTFEDFLTELNKLDEFEQANVLDKVGITGQRQLSAVKLMAQNVGFVNEQLKISRDATGALGEEFAKKVVNTASQLKILKNNLNDIGITVGNELLPKITALTQRFVTFLNTPGAQGQIKQFAKDLAAGFESLIKLAEKIDFRQIGDSLKTAAFFGKGLIQAFLGAPQWLQTAVVTGWGLNKLTGGAVQNIMADLTKAVIGGALQQFVARGATPANPLFVADVTGGGGAAGALAGGGKWAKIGKLIGGAFAIVAVAEIADAIHGAISPEGGLEGRIAADKLLPADKLSWPWGPKNTPKWIIDGPFGPINVLGGDSGVAPNKPLPVVDMSPEARQDRADARRRAERAHFGADKQTQHLDSIGSAVKAMYHQLHADLLAQIHVLKTSRDPAAIAAAVAAAVNDIKGGAGSAGTTKGLLGDLKAQLAAAVASGNTELAGKIRDAIKQIEPFQKGRQWQQAQLDEARKIVASNKTTAQKTEALRSIQASLLSHQRTMAANIVAGLLRVENSIKLLPGQTPVVNNYTGFVTGGTDIPNTPPKPSKLGVSNQVPTADRHATGFLGLTTGASDIGIAGEAGTEAVAIVKNPRKIQANTAKVFVTNWPSGMGSDTKAAVEEVAKAKKMTSAETVAAAVAAIRKRAIAAGHTGAEGKVQNTLKRDRERGFSWERIIKVTSSVKDTADKTIIRHRWGQTAVQAGGG